MKKSLLPPLIAGILGLVLYAVPALAEPSWSTGPLTPERSWRP